MGLQLRPPHFFSRVVARRANAALVEPALEIQGNGGLALKIVDGRVQGVRGALSPRYELVNYFGENGHVCINADLASGTEATREPCDRNFEVLGVNHTSALVTYDPGGGLLLTTNTADLDAMIVLPHLDTKQTAWAGTLWGTEDQVEWNAVIVVRDIVKATVWAGLKLTNVSALATDDDSCYFRFLATESAFWRMNTSRAGTDTTTATAVTVADETIYHLRISIDDARVPRFYINGTQVSTSAEEVALTNNIDLIPYIGVSANGTTPGAKALTIVSSAISMQPK